MAATEPPANAKFLASILEHAARVADQLHPHQLDRTRAAINAELEAVEGDLSAFVTPLLQWVNSHPDVKAEVKTALQTILAPEHQSQLVIVAAAAYALVREFVSAAIAPYVQDVANVSWSRSGNQTMPLSPSVLAEMALKGVPLAGNAQIGDPALAGEAALSGVRSDRFAAMTQASGQSFGLETALLMLRRGQITLDEFTKVLEYSNINPEFYAMALNAEYLPPSIGEVLHGALTGHLDPTLAPTYFGFAGLDPQTHFDWMLAASGHPISLSEALMLFNRGKLDLPGLLLAAQHEGLQSTYTQYVPELAIHYPPLFQVERAVKAKFMTPARATQILGYEGYVAEDVTAIVNAAQSTATTTVKEASLSTVLRQYEQEFIDAPTATTKIEALKFDAGTAEELIAFADENRAYQLKLKAANKIGSLYIAHKIDKTQATTDMGAIGLPAKAQLLMFAMWDIERAATIKEPTEAQVLHAYRQGTITPLDTKTRLVNMGYQQADLAIVVASAFPPTKPNPIAVDAVVNA